MSDSGWGSHLSSSSGSSRTNAGADQHYPPGFYPTQMNTQQQIPRNMTPIRPPGFEQQYPGFYGMPQSHNYNMGHQNAIMPVYNHHLHQQQQQQQQRYNPQHFGPGDVFHPQDYGQLLHGSVASDYEFLYQGPAQQQMNRMGPFIQPPPPPPVMQIHTATHGNESNMPQGEMDLIPQRKTQHQQVQQGPQQRLGTPPRDCQQLQAEKEVVKNVRLPYSPGEHFRRTFAEMEQNARWGRLMEFGRFKEGPPLLEKQAPIVHELTKAPELAETDLEIVYDNPDLLEFEADEANGRRDPNGVAMTVPRNTIVPRSQFFALKPPEQRSRFRALNEKRTYADLGAPFLYIESAAGAIPVKVGYKYNNNGFYPREGMIPKRKRGADHTKHREEYRKALAKAFDAETSRKLKNLKRDLAFDKRQDSDEEPELTSSGRPLRNAAKHPKTRDDDSSGTG